MLPVTAGLILIVILIGTLPPAQAGINATLSQHHGHPLWGALTNTLVASLALGLAIATLRVPHAGLRSLAEAPPWSWLGGLMGATMVLSAITLAPRLGAAAYVCAMVVGTVTASIAIDHFGLVGFVEHPATTWRVLGGALVISGMVLVQMN